MHQRKPWNRALSAAATKEYKDIVATRIRQLLSCLENLAHGPARKEGTLVDIGKWLNYFT
jgi:hypothetical protein